MSGDEDFTSVLETIDDRSATNSPDTIGISRFMCYEIYAMSTYFLTVLHAWSIFCLFFLHVTGTSDHISTCKNCQWAYRHHWYLSGSLRVHFPPAVLSEFIFLMYTSLLPRSWKMRKLSTILELPEVSCMNCFSCKQLNFGIIYGLSNYW